MAFVWFIYVGQVCLTYVYEPQAGDRALPRHGAQGNMVERKTACAAASSGGSQDSDGGASREGRERKREGRKRLAAGCEDNEGEEGERLLSKRRKAGELKATYMYMYM